MKFFSKVNLSKLDFNLLIVLLAPVVLVLSNQEWLFPYGNPSDSWLNTSFFYNYGDSELFDSYKVSRLSWILKGIFFHKLFNPLLANYLLHLTMLYGCLLAFYYIVKGLFNKNVAAIGAICFITYSQFHSIISFEWDYHSHDGALNILMTFLCLMYAARKRQWKTLLFLSGVFFSSAMQSPYNIVYCPMIALWYLYLNKQDRSNPILPSIFYAALGAILVQVFYCTVNYVNGGPFFYYAPQIAFMKYWGSVGKFYPNYWVDISQAITNSSIKGIKLPLIAFMLSVGSLVFYKYLDKVNRGIILICTTGFLICSAFHIFYQLNGHPFLTDDHFIVALAPISFLVIACFFGVLESYIPKKYINRITGLTFIVCTGVFVLGSDFKSTYFNIAKNFNQEKIIWCMLTLYLVGFVILKTKKINLSKLAMPTMMLSISYIALANVVTSSIPVETYAMNFECGYLKDQYAAVHMAYQEIMNRDERALRKLWYENNEIISHKKEKCQKVNLAGVYGSPTISLSGLYGAIWGAKYQTNYNSGKTVQYPHIESIAELNQSGITMDDVPDDIQLYIENSLGSGPILLDIDALIFGRYMWTERFEDIPANKYWKVAYPKNFKLVILTSSDERKQVAMNTLKREGYEFNISDEVKIEHGTIAFNMIFGDVVNHAT